MKKKWIYWTCSLSITLVAIAINGIFFRVKNIIPLEFSPNADTMQAIIEKIVPNDKPASFQKLEMNTIVDYIFIVGYSLLTFFSLKLILGVFDAPVRGWVYVMAIMTGFFDIIENMVLMSSAIRQREDFTWFFHAIVRIKWALAIIPAMLIPIACIYSLIILFGTREKKEAVSLTS